MLSDALHIPNHVLPHVHLHCIRIYYFSDIDISQSQKLFCYIHYNMFLWQCQALFHRISGIKIPHPTKGTVKMLIRLTDLFLRLHYPEPELTELIPAAPEREGVLALL